MSARLPLAPIQETPCHAAFPAPKTTAAIISRSEVLGLLLDETRKGAESDYVLVDLRREDHEGGTISTSINLPAQSLYPSIPVLYTIFKKAGIKMVIWYCGSSIGRATRAGGLFADYIVEKEGKGAQGIQSLVLEGGIKGWVGAGPEYVDRVDRYEASVWNSTR
ncbi:hypothetical protein PAAG_03179 [Paracoccidioides lutzii Pb01]|uniref:Rhodanese domain-containing protein n=1 Tax=Paracoccidioides lutzii (strain ATCC MYA-826 / Pb01) TaxID=502779 RepID=C1GYM5_PARBA|nr:hypothetical protein PAAG_03179 [Paracoccidioides lutzii Pb01]EEH41616.1 hypothetical protein PAAG_03179 [Paracoccidioides lutzii Pb01]